MDRADTPTALPKPDDYASITDPVELRARIEQLLVLLQEREEELMHAVGTFVRPA